MTTALGVFPNVPDLPGVPPVPRKLGIASIAAGALYLSDLFQFPVSETWGVFDSNGNQVLSPDSFLGIRYRNSNHISDYPVEDGAFASYNRVQTPFDAHVSLAKGGTLDERQAFMKAVEALFAPIDLYTLITPELTYSDVSIEDHEYERRTRNGAHIIIAHIHFLQVRILPNPGVYAQPTATSPQYRGQVAAVTPLDSVLAAAPITQLVNW